MALFIGRLNQDIRSKDLEDVFHKFGRISRCDVKQGYGFVEFDDRRDAEDAMKACDGLEIMGARIAVEWAKGPNRKSSSDECFKCGRSGHWARDCSNAGGRDRGHGRSRDMSPYRRGGSGLDRRRYDSDSDSRSRSRSRTRSRSRSCTRSRSRSRTRSRSRSRSRDRYRGSRARRHRSRSGSRGRRSRYAGSSRRHRSRSLSRSPSPSDVAHKKPSSRTPSDSPRGRSQAAVSDSPRNPPSSSQQNGEEL